MPNNDSPWDLELDSLNFKFYWIFTVFQPIPTTEIQALWDLDPQGQNVLRTDIQTGLSVGSVGPSVFRLSSVIGWRLGDQSVQYYYAGPFEGLEDAKTWIRDTSETGGTRWANVSSHYELAALPFEVKPQL